MNQREKRERKFLEMLDSLKYESSELCDLYADDGNEEKRIYYLELYLKLNSIYVDFMKKINKMEA